jgi:hypothetical protein
VLLLLGLIFAFHVVIVLMQWSRMFYNFSLYSTAPKSASHYPPFIMSKGTLYECQTTFLGFNFLGEGDDCWMFANWMKRLIANPKTKK